MGHIGKLRKQNPKLGNSPSVIYGNKIQRNFQKFHFGNVTERHLRKQNPDKNTEYLVIILIFLGFLETSPSVIYKPVYVHLTSPSLPDI